MIERTCKHCGAKIYSVIEPVFCPRCKKKWSNHKPIGISLSNLPEIKRKEVTKVPKIKKTFKTPSGGTYTKMVESAAGKKSKAKAKAPAKGKAKAAAPKGARTIQHKAYSYTTKKGKKITVAAHAEHIK